MMRRVHFYDTTTGVIRPGCMRVAESELQNIEERNTPDGCKIILGVRDPLRQRVDLETGELIDDDSKVAAEAKARRRAAALSEIQALEAKQHRRVRELLLASGDQQLQDIADNIDRLRRQLSEGEPS